MIRKVIIVLLTLSSVSCGTQRACYTFGSGFVVAGHLVDGRTGEPLQDVFMEIRVMGEEGRLGNVATGITYDTGEISTAFPREPDYPLSNRVVIETVENCVFYFDTWPFVLAMPARRLGPLPDPTRTILTIEPDEAASEITIDFTQDMLTGCVEDRTSCTLDLGVITLEQP